MYCSCDYAVDMTVMMHADCCSDCDTDTGCSRTESGLALQWALLAVSWSSVQQLRGHGVISSSVSIGISSTVTAVIVGTGTSTSALISSTALVVLPVLFSCGF